jgi:hypothetical protein
VTGLLGGVHPDLDQLGATALHLADGGTTADDELLTWFNDTTRELDATIYCRRLYEVMAAYWPTGESDPASTRPMRESARIRTRCRRSSSP